ncbi:MAG: serpin family protein [Bacteroidota bacterium]|nr:serpin family protein [Bacteroidota bacterium]
MKKSKVFRILVFIIIIFPVSLSSCNKDDDNLPKEAVPIILTQDQVALIGSGNSFAFDIFKRVLSGTPGSNNVMISPLSISYALSMTVNGADGSTRDSILKALRVNGLSVDALNKSYKSLTEALLSVDKRVLMSIANSVWTENNFIIRQAFINILTEYYKADSKSFDIDDPTAPDKINAWISDKTNGLIKNMVDKLSDNDVMLLINAIYFKGKWSSEFDKSKTTQMPFYKNSGLSADVPMMKQEKEYKVFRGSGFIFAEFPYGQGNFVMDVIVPDDNNGLQNILPSVTDSNLTTWVSQLSNTKVDLSFPKFKYGFKIKLKDILSDMGMSIAFHDGADFSNISDQFDLLINEVTHQSFIETNEEGTEAAAATVVEIGVTSFPPSLLVLKLDHPFLYIIRETTTNSIIFMGRVSDPLMN